MARAKKETTKATETKAAEVKAEPAAEVKAETKAAKTETKAAKTETKKTTTKAAKETIKCTIEFSGKNTTIESIVNSIKEAYAAEGRKDAIKTLDVYIQPENNVAYYVINGNEEGNSVNF